MCLSILCKLIFHKLVVLLAKFLYAVEELLDILDAVGVVGVVIVAQEGDDAGVVDYLFGQVVGTSSSQE